MRRSAYLSIGKIYFTNKNLQSKIIKALDKLLAHDDSKIRQTVINAAGEIGKKYIEIVKHILIKVCLINIILHAMQLLAL